MVLVCRAVVCVFVVTLTVICLQISSGFNERAAGVKPVKENRDNYVFTQLGGPTSDSVVQTQASAAPPGFAVERHAVDTAPSGKNNLYQCLLKSRHELLRRVCHIQHGFNRSSQYVPPRATKGFTEGLKRRRQQPTFHGVVFSKKHQIVFCQVNKAGVFSSIDFFRMANGGNFTRFAAFNDAKGQTLDGRAVMIKEFPLKLVKEYGNYRPMVIVRHPLQRLVSAYYQVVVQGVGGKHLNNFLEFIQNIVLNDNWFDVHAMTSQEACFPCYMEYDVIFRTETVSAEFPHLRESLGFGADVEFPSSHPNLMGTAAEYKYDPMLRDFERDHPDLFRLVLKKYSLDMEMFGYTWVNHSSGVKDSEDNC